MGGVVVGVGMIISWIETGTRVNKKKGVVVDVGADERLVVDAFGATRVVAGIVDEDGTTVLVACNSRLCGCWS